MTAFFNKKGDVRDIILLVMIFVVVAISIPLVSKINSEVKTQFLGTLEANTSDYNSSEAVLTNSQTAIRTWNIGGALFLIGIAIILIVSAFFIPTHPLFYFISLFINAIFFLVIPIFSNLYTQIRTQPLLSSEFAYFGLPNAVMDKLPLIFILLVALTLIVTFGKNALSTSGTI